MKKLLNDSKSFTAGSPISSEVRSIKCCGSRPSGPPDDSGLNDLMAYERATDVFKWEVPQNYYDLEVWNLDWDTASAQVALLLQHIARLPEFQLH